MKIKFALSFFERLKGLMFKEEIGPDEGLFFFNTSRIHTCFMKFDLEVVYFDSDFKKIDSEIIGPWKKGKKVEGARHILELPAKNLAEGEIEKIEMRLRYNNG